MYIFKIYANYIKIKLSVCIYIYIHIFFFFFCGGSLTELLVLDISFVSLRGGQSYAYFSTYAIYNITAGDGNIHQIQIVVINFTENSSSPYSGVSFSSCVHISQRKLGNQFMVHACSPPVPMEGQIF
jgi:hypothetical protein